MIQKARSASAPGREREIMLRGPPEGKRIEAALLYTAGPTLHILPPALLASQKADLVATEQSLGSRA